jgi:hypothetical protein
MENLIQPTTLKMFKWKANDCGNNDCYDSYYAYDMKFVIDEGESSLITEEQLTERFIQASMRVLKWKEEDDNEKLTWKLVKHRDGEYSIECCDVDHSDDWEGYASTLTELEFTTKNVFQLI